MTDPDDDGEREQFSVAVFYPDGSHAYAERWIDGLAAVRRFRRLVESPAAGAGFIVRVIVTDGGDFTTMEWRFGLGYTYPPELVARTAGPRQ